MSFCCRRRRCPQHAFEVARADGGRERRTSTFLAYGSDAPGGDTIMARTVGVTAAIGVEVGIS